MNLDGYAMFALDFTQHNPAPLTITTQGELIIGGRDPNLGTIHPVYVAGQTADNADGLAATGTLPLLVRTVAETFGWNGATWDRLRSSIANGLQVDVTRISGSVVVAGNKTPADGLANPTDAQDVMGFSMGWNGATWDRLRSAGDNNAALAQLAAGVPRTIAEAYGFDGTNWVPLKSTADNADGVAATAGGIFREAAETYGWNGATWDRVRSGADNADAVAVVALGIQRTAAENFGWNGASWDRLRSSIANGLAVDVTRVQGTVTVSGTVAVTQSTSPWVVAGNKTPADAAAVPTDNQDVSAFLAGYDGTVANTYSRVRNVSNDTLRQTTAIGILGVAQVAQWVVTHRPAAATKATITKGAGAAGVRHVAVGWSCSLACGATAQTPLNVDLIDGASGGAARLWSGAVSAPVNDCTQIESGPTALIGSAATGMTIEFSAAGVAASLETVTLWGYSTTN